MSQVYVVLETHLAPDYCDDAPPPSVRGVFTDWHKAVRYAVRAETDVNLCNVLENRLHEKSVNDYVALTTEIEDSATRDQLASFLERWSILREEVLGETGCNVVVEEFALDVPHKDAKRSTREITQEMIDAFLADDSDKRAKPTTEEVGETSGL